VTGYGSGPYGGGLYGLDDLGSHFTQRLYNRLPTLYRDADTTPQQLLRFISLLGDQADEVETLTYRIGYQAPDDGGAAGDTSDLTDPTAADTAWLPWLAQLVGVRAPVSNDLQALRDAILYATTGWRAGTRAAIAGAAKSALTGTRYVHVYDHSISSPGDGTEWDVLLVTRITETPDVPAVLQAVVDGHAKPAGVTLHHRAYSATWAAVDAAYPTWADRNGLTWAHYEETGL
jgi:hypothetical protein